MNNLSLWQKMTASWRKWMGKPVDYDKEYANQCVDWVKQYAKEIDNTITTYGNAKGFATIGLGINWKRTLRASPGDIIVFTSGTYGHIGVVQKIEGKTIYVVDQNRDGRAYRNNDKKNLGTPVSVSKYTLTGKEVFFTPV